MRLASKQGFPLCVAFTLSRPLHARCTRCRLLKAERIGIDWGRFDINNWQELRHGVVFGVKIGFTIPSHPSIMHPPSTYVVVIVGLAGFSDGIVCIQHSGLLGWGNRIEVELDLPS